MDLHFIESNVYKGNRLTAENRLRCNKGCRVQESEYSQTRKIYSVSQFVFVPFPSQSYIFMFTLMLARNLFIFFTAAAYPTQRPALAR